MLALLNVNASATRPTAPEEGQAADPGGLRVPLLRRDGPPAESSSSAVVGPPGGIRLLRAGMLYTLFYWASVLPRVNRDGASKEQSEPDQTLRIVYLRRPYGAGMVNGTSTTP